MGSAGRNPTDRTYLSIREVLDLLVVEFPDVTISKIRFLESRGLISPERTPSGYRKFYEPDVSRLRWILRQQREHFLPLKVIKGRLESENGGTVEEPAEPSLFDSVAGGSYSEIAAGDSRRENARPEGSLGASGHPSRFNESMNGASSDKARESARALAEVPRGEDEASHAARQSGRRAVMSTITASLPRGTSAAHPQEQAATDASAPPLPVSGEPPVIRATRRSPLARTVSAEADQDVAISSAESTENADPITGLSVAEGGLLGPSVTGAPVPGAPARGESVAADPVPADALAAASVAASPIDEVVVGSRASSLLQPADLRTHSPAAPAAAAPTSGAAASAARVSDSPAKGSDTAHQQSVEAEPPASGRPGRGRNAATSARLPARNARADANAVHLTAEEVALAVSADVALIESLEEFGLIEGRDIAGVHCFGEEALGVAQAAVGFSRFGIEARHLRTFKHAAERESGLFAQVVVPLLLQRNPSSRARAEHDLAELAELGATLQGAFMQAAIRTLLGG